MSIHETSGTYPADFGHIVRASYNGKVVFVGIPNYRRTNVYRGAICIFEKQNNTW